MWRQGCKCVESEGHGCCQRTQRTVHGKQASRLSTGKRQVGKRGWFSAGQDRYKKTRLEKDGSGLVVTLLLTAAARRGRFERAVQQVGMDGCFECDGQDGGIASAERQRCIGG